MSLSSEPLASVDDAPPVHAYPWLPSYKNDWHTHRPVFLEAEREYQAALRKYRAKLRAYQQRQAPAPAAMPAKAKTPARVKAAKVAVREPELVSELIIPAPAAEPSHADDVVPAVKHLPLLQRMAVALVRPLAGEANATVIVGNSSRQLKFMSENLGFRLNSIALYKENGFGIGAALIKSDEDSENLWEFYEADPSKTYQEALELYKKHRDERRLPQLREQAESVTRSPVKTATEKPKKPKTQRINWIRWAGFGQGATTTEVRLARTSRAGALGTVLGAAAAGLGGWFGPAIMPPPAPSTAQAAVFSDGDVMMQPQAGFRATDILLPAGQQSFFESMIDASFAQPALFRIENGSGDDIDFGWAVQSVQSFSGG